MFRARIRARVAAVGLGGVLACSAPVPEAEPAAAAETATSERVASELERLGTEVAALEAAYTDEAAPADAAAVSRRLAHLVAVDQHLRGAVMARSADWSEEEVASYVDGVWKLLRPIDRRNTEELRTLIAEHGWFSISTFGERADADGWLLVQHADHDPAFQRQVLAILAVLVESGETGKSNYAYLFDRVALAEGRPQRYGTQGSCQGPGNWQPRLLEDPERVDALRAGMGMSTLEQYRVFASQLCPRED